MGNCAKPSSQHQPEWKDQVRLGALTLSNRAVMAAMTRCRCGQDGVPTDLVAEHYSQRASVGFILTEATAWSAIGRGYHGAGCLYNKQQMEGWKKVIKAVHAKNGKIFVQLFHAGRVSHSTINGGQPIAPSPIAVRQEVRGVGQNYPVPKEMTLQDIEQTKKEFQQSIILAKEAGFDGVQLHAAHGYLNDQFLRTYTNQRKDKYGGSVQNRSRYTLQIIDIALKHFDPYRVGVKMSPVSRYNDMYDENPAETSLYLLKELDKRKIGFVEARESTEANPGPERFGKTGPQQISDVCALFRPAFSGILIGNDSFDAKTGLEKIRSGLCDIISFARHAIANPDLAERLINGWQLAAVDWKTVYGAGTKGYTDYPVYQQK